MINFEYIVDFLAAKGVRSLHIEMQSTERTTTSLEPRLGNLSETQTVRVEPDPRPCVCAGKHDLPVHRGAPAEPETIDGQGKLLTQTAAVLVKEDGTARLLTEPELKAQRALNPLPELRATKPEPSAVVPVVQPVVEPVGKKVPGIADEKVVQSASTPPAEKPAEKAKNDKPEKVANVTIPKQSLYETFCDLIANDDGGVGKEERLDLIGRMTLDDMLRINNDFLLGLDTDKPVEDVRVDVRGCFL